MDLISNQSRRLDRDPEHEPSEQPLIAPTGVMEVDAMADVLNRTGAAFTEPPPPEQGALGAANQIVGGAMGLISAPFELLDTGFAMATAPLAALAPGLPAATLLAPHIGPDHAHLHPPSWIPPAPPVPLPSRGLVLAAGVLSVLIGGIPATAAGDVGLAPTCGGTHPAFEIFTGSSSVFVGGARAARMLDITRHCDPASAGAGLKLGIAGVAAGALGGAAEAVGGNVLAAGVAAAQAAADAVALAMAAMLGKDPGLPPTIGMLALGNPTVLIGGLPMPEVLELFTGLGKVLRLGGEQLAKLRRGAGKPMSSASTLSTPGPGTRIHQTKCTDPSEPIDPFTGEVYNDFIDVRSPEGFVWARHYRSHWHDHQTGFGAGFRHGYEDELVLEPTRAILYEYGGERLEFPRREDGRYAGACMGRRLHEHGPNQWTIDRGGTRRSFERTPADERQQPRARLRQISDARSEQSLEYDEQGRLVRIHQNFCGHPFEVALIWNDRLITAIERGPAGQPHTRMATYEYGEHRELVRVRDALGREVTHAWDRARRMTRLTDRRGYSFYWSYDRHGRCVESWGQDDLWRAELRYEPGRTLVRKADGGEWVHVYSPHGELEAIIDPGGGIERFEHEDGRIVGHLRPDGRAFAWLYDDDGEHIGRLDEFARLLPPLDELPTPPDPLALELPDEPMLWLHGSASMRSVGSWADRVPPSIRADLRRFFAATTSASAPTPAPRHDALGRVIARPAADGSIECYELDEEGNVVARTDRDGSVWRYTIGSWNLQMAERDPLGGHTQWRFDAHANIRAIIDAGGNVSAYVHDRCDRLIEVHRHDRTRERYEYDSGGRLLAKLDGEDRPLLRFEPGERGLMRARILADGETQRFEYDRFGNVSRASNDAADLRMSHDLDNRRTADLRDGLGVEHQHDADGLRTTTYFGRFEVRHGRLGEGVVELLTPDGTRQVIRQSREGYVLRELGNGSRELSHFDHEGRCSGKLGWRAGHELPSWSVRYEHSPGGELRRVVDSRRGITEYEYDAAHRLILERTPDGEQRRIVYDAAGNIERRPGIEAAYGPGNMLVSVNGARVEHDSRDHVRAIIHDEGSLEFEYDSLDRLRCVRTRSRGEQVRAWETRDDALGRRVYKRCEGRQTDYWWDGDRLAAERDGAGRVRIYIYPDLHALVPLMFIEYEGLDANPSSGRAYWLFTNHIGVPSHVEDRDGQIVWFARHIDPYGELEIDERSTLSLALRFPGHVYDEETGLHDNRFRYYSPKLGRFLQSDPAGQSGGINLYAYSPRPTVEVDLVGLHPSKKKQKTGPSSSSSSATGPDTESTTPSPPSLSAESSTVTPSVSPSLSLPPPPTGGTGAPISSAPSSTVTTVPPASLPPKPYESPGGTRRVQSLGGTTYVSGAPSGKMAKKTRRNAAGYNNPPHSHSNMLPLWRKCASSVSPEFENEGQLRKWVMDPKRTFLMTDSTGSKTIKKKGHSNGVLGHGESAGANWNREGHKRPRKDNLAHNRQTSVYSNIEYRPWSDASGASEARYLSPGPHLESHPTYWDPSAPGFTGGSWPTWTRETPQPSSPTTATVPSTATTTTPPSVPSPSTATVPSPGGDDGEELAEV